MIVSIQHRRLTFAVAFQLDPLVVASPRKKSLRQLQKEEDIRTWKAEIDLLVAQHHKDLPRAAVTSIGALDVMYSTDKQRSVVDQVRQLQSDATKGKVYISRDRIFVDYGVRGASDRCPGLERLKAAAERREFQTLRVFVTNRLYRKLYKAVRYVEEEIVERGLRCIFVSSKIDTSDTNKWRLLLSLHGIMDEAYSGAFSDNIRAAHQGLAQQPHVRGSIAFGYKAVEVPGPLTKQKKPRRLLQINEATGEWVRRIFEGVDAGEGRNRGDCGGEPGPKKTFSP